MTFSLTGVWRHLLVVIAISLESNFKTNCLITKNTEKHLVKSYMKGIRAAETGQGNCVLYHTSKLEDFSEKKK